MKQLKQPSKRMRRSTKARLFLRPPLITYYLLLMPAHWWRAMDRKYRWKWRAANGLLAVLMIVSVVIPIVEHITQNNRYTLSAAATDLVGSTDASLAKQLTYDAQSATYQFNKDAIQSSNEASGGGAGGLPAALQKTSVGAADKSNTKSYALDVPADFSKGVTYHDTNSGLSFSLVPQFGAMNAKTEQGHVVFPIDGGNQAIYTLKNNGLKEDIVVPKVTQNSMTFSYKLNLPDTLQAKVIPDSGGSIGIYSADPSLFGDISYGSSKDQAAVEAARKTGAKTYLVFGLPAPVIKAPNGASVGDADARFTLAGNSLSVVAENLSGLKTAITIDPSVVVTATSDFQTAGNDEANIDFSTSGQINRGALTGGSVSAGWTTSGNNMTGAREAAGSVAYNGYLYVLGGYTSGTFYSDVQYTAINSSNGTIGAWATANTGTSFTNAREGMGVIAYNGYLYIFGGDNGSTVYTDTQYAPINANGTLGTWTSASSMVNARSGFGAAVYNGYLYALGGCGSTPGSCSSFVSAVEYAPINANGSVGTWATTTSLSQGVFGTQAVAYNGYLYNTGGYYYSSGNIMVNTVQYAPINANGTIGSWVATTGFTTARGFLSTTVYNGYLYIFGGDNVSFVGLGDTQYAPINANGTIGSWVATSSLAAPIVSAAAVAYGGYLYVVSGFTTADQATTQYAKIDPAGTEQAFTTSANTFTTNRQGAQTVAYGGFLYEMGGGSSSTPVATIYAAAIASDGTIGAFTNTGMTSFTTARMYFNAFAYNGYMYVLGGCTSIFTSCSTGSNDIATVYSAPITASTGAIGSWTAQTSFTTGRYAAGAVAYDGYAYIFGGGSGSTIKSDIQYAALGASGAITSWTTASSSPLPTATTGLGAVVNGGTLYIAGGCKAATGSTCTSFSSAVYHVALSSSGGVGTWSSGGTDASFTTARYGLAMTVTNGYLYISGGYDGSTVYATTQLAPINADGSVGTWVAGQSFSGIATGLTMASYNNTIYVVGGSNGGGTYYNSVRYAKVNNGGSGVPGSWSSTGSTVTSNRYLYATAYSNGYLYVISGATSTGNLVTDCTSALTSVYYAQLNANGTLGSWATTSSLNQGRCLFSSSVLNGYVYAMSGYAGTNPNRTTVEYAKINTNGTLGTWANTTAGMTGTNQARNFGSSATYNGHLYFVGGNYGAADTTEVDVATPTGTGDITSWTSTTGMPVTNHGGTSVAYNGYLYVIGGAFGGTDSPSVLYAPLNSDGTITTSTWAYTTAFPSAAYYTSAVAYNGFMYLIGGGANALTANSGNVLQAPIGANGTLGAWQNDTALSSSYYGGPTGAFVNKSTLYMLDSITPGTNLKYAAPSVINRAGQYSKLVDLGGLENLNSFTYNGTVPGGSAALTYAAYDATASLVSSGAAGSITSTSAVSCDGSVKAVRYVWVAITLDDSGTTAVFPDSSGTNNANVTDFTIGYVPGHPATNIRLRTGQTLQQGGLSPFDSCNP